MHNLLLDPPIRYGQRDNICRVLGIKNPAVLDRFLLMPRVSRLIDQQLVEKLGELPKLSDEDQRLADALLLASHDQFREIARVVAVLSQSKIVKRTVSGATLRAVVAFLDSHAILQWIRNTDLPLFAGLHPSAALDEGVLEAYAAKVEGFMFGLLPRNYQLRLILQRPQEQLPLALAIPDPKALGALKALIVAAMQYLADHKSENPDAGGTDENH